MSEETPAGGRPSVVARNTQALTATGLGEGTAREGMEQPAYYWDPVIAPGGMASASANRAA